MSVIQSVSADIIENEPVLSKSAWAIYMENDLFLTPNVDRDYTAGLSVVYSGTAAATHLFSIDPLLGLFDSLSGIDKYDDQKYHSFEFGMTGFTPDDIRTDQPVINDRPYASLMFIANNRQYVHKENKSSIISTLSLGVLGATFPGVLQNKIHRVVNLDRAEGWGNQISSEGEFTFRYGVSKQSVEWSGKTESGSYEIKTAVRASAGYISGASWSISGRWGVMNTPWWTFNPHTTEYTEKSAPALAVNNKSGDEFYFWAGLSIHLRAYNAFLQGQSKDSVIKYEKDELNSLILDAWFGVTKKIFYGMRLSYVMRGQTSEIKNGEGNRPPFWGGIIISQEF